MDNNIEIKGKGRSLRVIIDGNLSTYPATLRASAQNGVLIIRSEDLPFSSLVVNDLANIKIGDSTPLSFDDAAEAINELANFKSGGASSGNNGGDGGVISQAENIIYDNTTITDRPFADGITDPNLQEVIDEINLRINAADDELMGRRTLYAAGVTIDNTIRNITVIPKSVFPAGIIFKSGATRVYDAAGTEATYIGDFDADNIEVITTTMVGSIEDGLFIKTKSENTQIIDSTLALNKYRKLLAVFNDNTQHNLISHAENISNALSLQANEDISDRAIDFRNAVVPDGLNASNIINFGWSFHGLLSDNIEWNFGTNTDLELGQYGEILYCLYDIDNNNYTTVIKIFDLLNPEDSSTPKTFTFPSGHIISEYGVSYYGITEPSMVEEAKAFASTVNFDDGSIIQTEIGNTASHLNLNSLDRPTIETPSGKEKIAYLKDIDVLHEGLVDELRNHTHASFAGDLLTRVIGGSTPIQKNLFPVNEEFPVGKLVSDTNGTIGKVTGEIDGATVEIETLSTSPIGADEPTLLGTVATVADLPTVMSDAETLFGRTPDIDDYAIVLSHIGGLTYEFYVIDISSVTDPVITWGNERPLNTGDFQRQSDAGMSGKVLTGGAPGTFGTPVAIDTKPTEDSQNLVASGGVYNALADKLGNDAILLENGTDLNLLTKQGFYYSTAANTPSLINLPIDINSGIFVMVEAYSGANVAKQTLSTVVGAGTFGGSITWWRTGNYQSGNWTSWHKVAKVGNTADLRHETPMLLGNGMDLNSVITGGVYAVRVSANANTIVNAPVPSPSSFRLDVDAVDNSGTGGLHMVFQTFTMFNSNTSAPRTFKRMISIGSSLNYITPWAEIAKVDDVLSNIPTLIPAGDNLDNYRNPGLYRIASDGSVSNVPTHASFVGAGLMMLVYAYTVGGACVQIIFPARASDMTNMTWRTSTVAGGFTKWYLVDSNKTSNDRNNPSTWATSGEIDFSDGTYGIRRTGNIVAAANVANALSLITGSSTTKIISSGGWMTEGATTAKPALGTTLYATGSNTFVFNSSAYVSSANQICVQSLSAAARTGTTNNAYDVWIRYTK